MIDVDVRDCPKFLCIASQPPFIYIRPLGKKPQTLFPGLIKQPTHPSHILSSLASTTLILILSPPRSIVAMSFSSRRPTQQLNIRCSKCGSPVVKFESFVSEGEIFEMVGTKLSEMMAFIHAAPESILCTSCTTKAAEDAALQRQLERERIYRRMEMRPDHPQAENMQQTAYGQPATLPKRDANKKESGFLRLLPRRALSTTERKSNLQT